MPAAVVLTISPTPEILAVVLGTVVLLVMALIGSHEMGDKPSGPMDPGHA